MEGWIKLHRSFLDHWLCDEYRPLTKREAWETMLFMANYEDKKVLINGQLIDCRRGQCLYSIESWAKKFVWTIGQVRHFFKLLENDKMIVVEGMKYTTRLTICNYDKYQDKQQTDNELTTNSQQTDNELTTTTKEVKKDKKLKKEKNIELDFNFVNLSFKEPFEKWIDYKKGRKQMYKTQESLEDCYNNLVALSGRNPQKAMQIVCQSTGNNWSGLFELKGTKTSKNDGAKNYIASRIAEITGNS